MFLLFSSIILALIYSVRDNVIYFRFAPQGGCRYIFRKVELGCNCRVLILDGFSEIFIRKKNYSPFHTPLYHSLFFPPLSCALPQELISCRELGHHLQMTPGVSCPRDRGLVPFPFFLSLRSVNAVSSSYVSPLSWSIQYYMTFLHTIVYHLMYDIACKRFLSA